MGVKRCRKGGNCAIEAGLAGGGKTGIEGGGQAGQSRVKGRLAGRGL